MLKVEFDHNTQTKWFDKTNVDNKYVCPIPDHHASRTELALFFVRLGIGHHNGYGLGHTMDAREWSADVWKCVSRDSRIVLIPDN